MTDPISGKSRCFGFVRFTEELERQRALIEMNGAWFAGRPLRVALATPRNVARRFNNRRFSPQHQQYQHHNNNNNNNNNNININIKNNNNNIIINQYFQVMVEDLICI